MKIKKICTLGPVTLNFKSLKFFNKNADILRYNLSHLSHSKLKFYLKKFKFINKKICIDTEGAQIRTTKIPKKIFLKKNQKIFIKNENNNSSKNIINLYPEINFKDVKKNSKIYIGFEGLELKVTSVKKNYLAAKVVSAGVLDSNKGVHFSCNVNLDFLTKKDLQCISTAKNYGIKNYALSFTNNHLDVVRFRKLIGKESFLISKIETKKAIKNIKKILKFSDAILIDRGDLSRYVSVAKIPTAQLKILKISNKVNKEVFIATNLLETMVNSKLPTRAESNDIFFSLISGASGLVLAAETAIGKYPIQCLNFINDCIKSFKNYKKNYFSIK